MSNIFVITTYRQLNEFCKSWVSGEISELVIVGEPGIGKTSAASKASEFRDAVFITARNSPIEFYQDLYLNRGSLIVIDDTEGLLNTREGKALIRSLTERNHSKTLVWNTQAAALKKAGVPTRFQTTSRTLIVTNEWSGGGIYKAIASRATVIRFKPSAKEVLDFAKKWFDDKEILLFARQHQDRWHTPDFRLLEKTREIKNSRMSTTDWRAFFLNECGGPDKVAAVAEILADPLFRTAKDREMEFKRRGCGSRASYFRTQKDLKSRRSPTSTPSSSPNTEPNGMVTTLQIAGTLIPMLEHVLPESMTDSEVGS
jgi:hypothetical protein